MTKGMKGQSNHSLDAKGRLIIPTRFREGLGSKFVLCFGMDNNLYIYPQDEWDKFSEKLNTLPISDPNARRFKTFFQGSACDCEVDSHFRIVISPALRKHAGIDKDVVMVGNGSIVEIWNTEAWDKYNSPEEMDIDAISKEMSSLYGI